jgi:hypothetical protein
LDIKSNTSLYRAIDPLALELSMQRRVKVGNSSVFPLPPERTPPLVRRLDKCRAQQ